MAVAVAVAEAEALLDDADEATELVAAGAAAKELVLLDGLEGPGHPTPGATISYA